MMILGIRDLEKFFCLDVHPVIEGLVVIGGYLTGINAN